MFKPVIMSIVVIILFSIKLTAGSYNEKIVFLGDSLTAYADWNELFPSDNIINRGISGNTTQDIYNRLGAVIKDAPKKIFIMVGINDIIRGKSVDDLILTYNKILKVLINRLPNADIYVISVLPVNFSGDLYNLYVNTTVIAANEKIKQSVKKHTKKDKVKFLDIYGTFTKSGTSGLIPMYTYDGIHLTHQGYLNWKQQIRPYVN
ncbi:MAG: GDSL-type esterase/lipase family protein [Nitrospirota bacterium]